MRLQPGLAAPQVLHGLQVGAGAVYRHMERCWYSQPAEHRPLALGHMSNRCCCGRSSRRGALRCVAMAQAVRWAMSQLRHGLDQAAALMLQRAAEPQEACRQSRALHLEAESLRSKHMCLPGAAGVVQDVVCCRPGLAAHAPALQPLVSLLPDICIAMIVQRTDGMQHIVLAHGAPIKMAPVRLSDPPRRLPLYMDQANCRQIDVSDIGKRCCQIACYSRSPEGWIAGLKQSE